MLLRAFAKINLDLRILNRRDDGYHEVRTVFQTIDWHDEILIEPSDRFEFLVHAVRPPGSPALENGETNLVVRAVREYERATSSRVSARIELTKHIPMGAGLGGGSADAAVTLLGLERLLGRQLSGSDLLGCLRRLGADVPFFALGGRAVGVGRGDEVYPLPDGNLDGNPDGNDDGYDDDPSEPLQRLAEPLQRLVVVDPGIHISSAEAYSWLTVSDKSNSIVGFCAQFVHGRTTGAQVNDFEAVVLDRHPVLAHLKQELLRAGAFRASLSGTGSAIFGIFRTEDEAVEAASNLGGSFAARVVRPLSRSEYLRRIFE